MKIIKFKISKKNKLFLSRYHPDNLKVERWDEIGTMAFGIISTSWDREKYKEYDEYEFELKHNINDFIELKLDDDKFLSLRNLLTVENTLNRNQKGCNQINPCLYRFNRYERPKKYTEIKFIVCREASVSFNGYLDKLLNRVFLAYMKYEVLHLKKKIIDAIHDFQSMYDLSDDEYSSETCKRYWQRHKDDAMTPYPLLM